MNFVPRKMFKRRARLPSYRRSVNIFELDVEERPPPLPLLPFFLLFFSKKKRNEEERHHRGSRTTRFSSNTIGTLVADDPTKSIESKKKRKEFVRTNSFNVPFPLIQLDRKQRLIKLVASLRSEPVISHVIECSARSCLH